MDLGRYMDSRSGQFTEEQRAVLKALRPSLFTEKGRIRKNWRDLLGKRPLTADEFRLFILATEKGRNRIMREGRVRSMLRTAKAESGARFPHTHFCKLIAQVDGVEVTDIRIMRNNDTFVDFKYRGNTVTAGCTGNPIEGNEKFLPTSISVNGAEKDVTGLDIRDVVKSLPARKVYVVRRKA